MKQKIILIGFIAALVVGLLPNNVWAASASMYVSPASSSITKGGNVVVSVRVNSGANLMDTVQASLNYDGSKLQYVSYAAGSFTTFSGSNSGSSFSYVGALYGGSTSGDKSVFSVTFKSLAAGTATLSISGAALSYAGTAFSPVSVSSGSVTISNPVVVDDSTDTTPTTAPTTTPSTPSTIPTVTEAKDTTAPKLSGKVSSAITSTTINLKFKTDEKAKIQVKYTIGKTALSISDNTANTDHDLTIGTDKPLSAGLTYKVEIIAIDATGNKATIYSQNIRTTGVEYSVRITDINGQPLKNHKVSLHSDPIDVVTNDDGVATFSDVTPGEHTLIFDIDGLSMSQKVTVGSEIAMASDENNTAESIKLPVEFAMVEPFDPAEQTNYWMVAAAAMVFGALVATLVRITAAKKAFGWLNIKIRRIIFLLFRKKSDY